MRRKLKIALIAIGATAAGLIALPPIETTLLEQPSCLAFVGMIPPSKDEAVERAEYVSLTSRLVLEQRQKAVAQNAIPSPKPPYVIVTRTSTFNNVNATNILVALKDARSDTWRVYEANQLFDQSKNIPTADFTQQPTRILGYYASRKLDRLIRKRCLFNEPGVVGIRPRVWFSFPTTYYYDGESRKIEVNNGKRSGLFAQTGHAYGIAGALGDRLVRNAIGFNYPPYRDPETEPE
jgi:hypothetical protein